jgi:DNA-binding response OmpR family regulator
MTGKGIFIADTSIRATLQLALLLLFYSKMKKKVILVDDDQDIREALYLGLRNSPYEISMYESGNEILNKHVDAPDLFILDRNISGQNGIDICKFIKADEKYSHVPVLIMSAYPDIQIWAAEAGANDVLKKPFSIHTLRSIINKFLA